MDINKIKTVDIHHSRDKTEEKKLIDFNDNVYFREFSHL